MPGGQLTGNIQHTALTAAKVTGHWRKGKPGFEQDSLNVNKLQTKKLETAEVAIGYRQSL